MGSTIVFDHARFHPVLLGQAKVRRMFSLGPETDKLVSYYSATHWAGRLPAQGWVYLTVDHLAFYAFLLGVETKVVTTWHLELE